MLLFLLFFIIQGINCSDLIFPLTLKGQCIKLCQEHELPVLNPFLHDNIENIICQSGCRLFDTQFGGGLNIIPALKRCQTGCEQTFVSETEISICRIGCDRIASKVQSEIQKILVMSPQERFKNSIGSVGSQTDGVDSVDTDLLFDPSIRSQLDIGFHINYKIPETYIRTMPIEEKDKFIKGVLTKSKETGDWLDCASKNSGIPRWILLSTMLGAIIVAIWLTLSMESRKNPEDCDDDVLMENPDNKHMEGFMIEKDISLLENGTFRTSEEKVEFLPPPKYSEVNELEYSEPPNYSEAVHSQHGVENV